MFKLIHSCRQTSKDTVLSQSENISDVRVLASMFLKKYPYEVRTIEIGYQWELTRPEGDNIIPKECGILTINEMFEELGDTYDKV